MSVLTASPFRWTEVPQPSGFGSVLTVTFELETELTLPADLTFYLKPPAFEPPGPPPPALSSARPPEKTPLIGFTIPADTSINTEIPADVPPELSFLKASVTAKQQADKIKYVFTLKIILGAELHFTGYENINNAFWVNFFSEKNALPGRASVFDTPKGLIINGFLTDETGEPEFFSGLSPSIRHLFTFPGEDRFHFKRDSKSVDHLSSMNDTRLKITLPAGATEAAVWAILKNASSSGFQPLVVHRLSAQYPPDPTPEFPAGILTAIPETALTGHQNGTVFSVRVEAERLISGQKYEFICAGKYADGTPFAFRSKPTDVHAVPEMIPPEITSELIGFHSRGTNALQVIPQEEIITRLNINTQNYQANRETDFLTALKEVQITHYHPSEEGITHVLNRVRIQKSPDGFRNLPENLTIEPSSAGPEITYRFRIRNEKERPSLFSYLQTEENPLPRPQINQDWSGKTVFIEYKFILQQASPESFEDVLIFTQRVDVLPVDETIFNYTLTDENGQPVRQWLADIKRLTVNGIQVEALFSRVPQTGTYEAFTPANTEMLPARKSSLFNIIGSGNVQLNASEFGFGVPYEILAAVRND